MIFISNVLFPVHYNDREYIKAKIPRKKSEDLRKQGVGLYFDILDKPRSQFFISRSVLLLLPTFLGSYSETDEWAIGLARLEISVANFDI